MFSLAQPVINQSRAISKFFFRQRFTPEERVILEIAQLDDTSATLAARQQAAALRSQMKDLEMAQYIDLDDPRTQAGVQALEAATLIAAGRANEILFAPIQEYERP